MHLYRFVCPVKSSAVASAVSSDGDRWEHCCPPNCSIFWFCKHLKFLKIALFTWLQHLFHTFYYNTQIHCLTTPPTRSGVEEQALALRRRYIFGSWSFLAKATVTTLSLYTPTTPYTVKVWCHINLIMVTFNLYPQNLNNDGMILGWWDDIDVTIRMIPYHTIMLPSSYSNGLSGPIYSIYAPIKKKRHRIILTSWQKHLIYIHKTLIMPDILFSSNHLATWSNRRLVSTPWVCASTQNVLNNKPYINAIPKGEI